MDTENPLDHIPRGVLVQAAVALSNGALLAPLPDVEVTLASLRYTISDYEAAPFRSELREAVAQIEKLRQQVAAAEERAAVAASRVFELERQRG
jgi:hypothetical protein